MAQDGDLSGTWSQEIRHDALVADDDFTKFLDLENGFDAFQQQINDNHGHSGLDTPMQRLAFAQNTMQNLAGQTPDMMQHMNMMGVAHDSNAFASSMQHQQFPQYQLYQQMDQSQHFQIPPTPVSNEMHAAKYAQQVENAGQLIFDRNQASFTPLVSPAQTPLDNSWSMTDFVGVDDFFSPLTSPAIEAQPAFTSASATASPIDLNVEHSAVAATSATTAKKSRRKAAQPRPTSTVRSLKHSPAMKPQNKRRQFSLSTLSLDKIDTMLDKPNDRLQPNSSKISTFASSEDSVSPEPIFETLMRPPPVPSNAVRSPASALRSPMSDMPATPAMLMRMPGNKPGKGGTSNAVASNEDVMEDIALPDAATELPTQMLPGLGLRVNTEDNDSTPVISAKTPKLSADSTPRTSAMKNANQASEPSDKMKRPETKKGGRTATKRQSTSSAAISPALRPKVSISPNISPLVPAGGAGHVSAETSALLLASRSNYQNILDGTHLPGVSYPETLAENLSSKRTSHKIAEQGRRNRINLALKEIEGLLPPSITTGVKREKSSGGSSKENEDGSPDKNGGVAGASKASTVEMAIVYIKSLQAELHTTKKKLEAAEKLIAEGSSNGSQTSEAGCT